jgi:hypothetical protein
MRRNYEKVFSKGILDIPGAGIGAGLQLRVAQSVEYSHARAGISYGSGYGSGYGCAGASRSQPNPAASTARRDLSGSFCNI